MLRKNLSKIFRAFIYVLPLSLFFSYYPIMSFGSDEAMNFEISVPLVWLVLFDILVFVMMFEQKMWFKDFKKKWVWLLLPLFLSVSVLWSLNSLRGVLTVGIVWLLYFAVDGMWTFRKLFDGEFRKRFWKWFFGATLLMCGWCLVQCILDLAGVTREYSLMCAGCTYRSFGFPHPNGFAIEPQFMGNLFLAPTLVVAYMLMKNDENGVFWRRVVLLAIFSATLFLTFSRGAIYALVVAMVVMSGWMIFEAKKRKEIIKKVGEVWIVTILAFLFTLNLQGIMAQNSLTNDTYQTGVAKVLNHLTLGVVDLRGKDAEELQAPTLDSTGKNEGNNEEVVVEKPVENSMEETRDEAMFDGYVAESTDTRLRLTGAAVMVWKQDFRTALFGVGLGGAGQALYKNGLSPAPKEIVQNQYASLLLETGIIGVLLLVFSLILVIRVIWKRPNKVAIVSLMIAYGVSLLFFSGLPNALQIYLMTALMIFIL